jgi:hypothetical protein
MDSSKAAYKWDRANTTRIGLKLQNNTDRDILELLARIGNKQGYIKRLIRDDLNGEKKYLDF